MVNAHKIHENYPKSYLLLLDFIKNECAEIYSNSAIIYFLDSKEIYVGITSIEGTDWLVEICGIVIDICSTRVEAESLGIAEGLEILENELNKINI